MTPPTAVDIPALVNAVCNRLKDKIDGYAIELFPDKAESYKLTHQRGAFLIAYRGSEYGTVEDTGDIVQGRQLSVDIVIETRQLAGAGDGAYTMLELARTALIGFKIPGFTKIAAVRERFLSRVETVWVYVLTISAATVSVAIDETLIGPALERLTMQSQFTTSEIPS
jgi:hypothetical protein